MKLTVVILTFNEAIHIERCITNVIDLADEIYVVDSNSTDNTVDIAKQLGVKVLRRDWTNHYEQFNWALAQINDDIDWVLRIDADEYLSSKLMNNFMPYSSTLYFSLIICILKILSKFKTKSNFVLLSKVLNL